MNIFLLDFDPVLCAQYHYDSHVVKMVLESAQMLCTAHRESGGIAPYKSAFRNHPCAVWTRTSLSNYKWLCELGINLCKEFTYRYNNKHKTQTIIEWCSTNLPNIKDIGFTEPAQAMPEFCKDEDPVLAYRRYYITEKARLKKYTKREEPDWM